MLCEIPDCSGKRLDTAQQCPFHQLDEPGLRRFLASGDIDGRGVRFDVATLELLLRTLPGGDAPVLGKAQFDRAVFDGFVDLAKLRVRDLGFRSSIFNDGLDLSSAVVQQKLDLRDATISRAVNLDELAVDGSIDLRGATVDVMTATDARLSNARFDAMRSERDVLFRRTVFTGKTVFAGARIDETADFGLGWFRGDALFDDAYFGDELILAGAEFDGVADMHRINVDGDAIWDGVRFNRTANFHAMRIAGDWRTAGAWCGEDFNCFFARLEQADGIGKMQIDGTFNLGESRWDESASFDIRAASVRCRRAEFRAGVDMIVAGDVDLSQTMFGAPSRVRGGVFWQMDKGPKGYVRDADGSVDRPSIMSLQGTDASDLVLSNVDLSRCRFVGAYGLDRLRFDGRVTFGETPGGLRWARRRTIREEHEWRMRQGWGGWEIDPVEPNRYWADPTSLDVAAIYRALRKGQEDAKDVPGGAEFYYGEMEMRRHAGRSGSRRATQLPTTTGRDLRDKPGWVETRLVFAYWALAGYGLRASRALCALAVLILGTAIVLEGAGFQPDQTFGHSVVFALGAALAFGTVPAYEGITTVGELAKIGLRVLGPACLGLMLLAIRGRLKR